VCPDQLVISLLRFIAVRLSYNGVTRPAVDGVGGTGAGSMSSAAMFGTLANSLFDMEPNKVSYFVASLRGVGDTSCDCDVDLSLASCVQPTELPT